MPNHNSEEVEEILSNPPSWLLRSGISLISLLLILFLAMAQLIQYPDVILANITLTTQQPPISIVSQVGGKITSLFVVDKQLVNHGDILAVLESSASYSDVLALKKDLLNGNYNQLEKTAKHIAVGDLQPAFATFCKALTDYNTFKMLNLSSAKIEATKKQIAIQNIYYERISQQEDILGQDLGLTEKRYRTDSMLEKNGTIAPVELDKSKGDLLQKKYSLQGARSSLVQIKVQQADLEQKIIELTADYTQTNSRLETDFSKALEALQAQIASYELHYILKAPIDGEISLGSYWANSQTIKAGDEVLVITPKYTGKLYGRIEIPLAGSAKVKYGQLVNIKLTGFPYQEYGMLIGKISSISAIATDKTLRATVTLCNNTITTYNKNINLSNKANSTGSAEIITQKRTVLERIFDKFKFAFHRYS